MIKSIEQNFYRGLSVWINNIIILRYSLQTYDFDIYGSINTDISLSVLHEAYNSI